MRTSQIIFMTLIVSVVATAQGPFNDDTFPWQARLLDGTILTPVLHPNSTAAVRFSTEGAIWSTTGEGSNIIGHANYQKADIVVVGKTVTLPDVISHDGGATWTQTCVQGTEVTDATGNRHPLTAQTWWTLPDALAADPNHFTNTGAGMRGATRSILDSARAMALNPTAANQMRSNYFTYLKNEVDYYVNNGTLDAGFATDAGWANGGAKYPVTAGGTYKCAGHVMQDANGNVYNIPFLTTPDEDRPHSVIELSENVCMGTIVDIRTGPQDIQKYNANGAAATGPGSMLTNTSGLRSFVLRSNGNDRGLLVVLNEDPRFPAVHVNAKTGQEVPMSALFGDNDGDGIPDGMGQHIEVIGHLTGNWFMLGHDVLTSMVSQTDPFEIFPTVMRFRDNGDRIRVRGFLASSDPGDQLEFSFFVNGANIVPAGAGLVSILPAGAAPAGGGPPNALPSFEARFDGEPWLQNQVVNILGPSAMQIDLLDAAGNVKNSQTFEVLPGHHE